MTVHLLRRKLVRQPGRCRDGHDQRRQVRAREALREPPLDLGLAPVRGRRHPFVGVFPSEVGREQAHCGQVEPALSHRGKQGGELPAARAAWMRL